MLREFNITPYCDYALFVDWSDLAFLWSSEWISPSLGGRATPRHLRSVVPNRSQ